jgi:hypothetical protein
MEMEHEAGETMMLNPLCGRYNFNTNTYFALKISTKITVLVNIKHKLSKYPLLYTFKIHDTR